MTGSRSTVRRSLVLGLVLLATISAACGGRDDAATTTAGTTPATTASPAPTTTAPPTTTSPPAPTTTTAQNTTVSPLAALVGDFTGEWRGEWVNTTFGSSGPMLVVLETIDDETFSVTADLGGSVFGQSDPDPEQWIFRLDELDGPVTVESTTFGEVMLILSPAGARITAGTVPAEGIQSFQLDASFAVGPRIVGTYFVGFDDGTVAEGTADLERIDP